MKSKLQELCAGLILIFVIMYIYGQFGSLDLNIISPLQFKIRTSVGIVVLGFVTWFINKHFKGGEWI